MSTHTGMLYPSRPPSADNDGAFACALPVYTHPAFKTVDLHKADGRSHWIFLRHPTQSAAFTDLSSLKIYLADLNDPNFKIEDHHNAEKISKHKKVLDLAHAHYKFCVTHHRHPVTPVQEWNSIQTVPERALHRLVFHDPSRLDQRLHLAREHYRMSKLFPSDYYTEEDPEPSASAASSTVWSSAAPVTPSPACASAEAQVGPWFLLSDGQVILDPNDAATAARNTSDGTTLTMRLVDTLADAQDLRKEQAAEAQQLRKAQAAGKAAGGG
ncbi:hypothetical protein B0H16DRAFT_1752378 [Mycena metata]|uniref:Uncharacterized protein n=1 Tax=Mycena metata TaxID=1033252 RepID=A0AAD7DHN6_9AGAR|nr:hypothetical protein B0H16DRAFT_1752378 [Mycena metata]